MTKNVTSDDLHDLKNQSFINQVESYIKQKQIITVVDTFIF